MFSKTTKQATNMVKQLLSIDAPLIFVESHEQLVTHVEKTFADVHKGNLVNIDFHSDLVSYGDQHNSPLADYNWVNHLSFATRPGFKYTWCSWSKGTGRCHSDKYASPFKGNSPWADRVKVLRYTKKPVEFNNIQGIGIVLSPLYLTFDTVRDAIVNILNHGYPLRLDPSSSTLTTRGCLYTIEDVAEYIKLKNQEVVEV
jgi:hypothetical protein